MVLMKRPQIALALVALLFSPLCGSIAASSCTGSETIPLNGPQLIGHDQSDEVPDQGEIWWNPNIEWWEVTSLDEDRNGIHDSIQTASGPVNIGLSYSREFTEIDRNVLRSMGFEIHVELPVVNAVLLGDVEPSQIDELARIEGVVMVERYGSVVFFGDVQTPAVKASNSTDYPIGAWDLSLIHI